MEGVFQFHFETKCFSLQALFVAKVKDVDELDRYTKYSIVEMFGYDIFGSHYQLDKLSDIYWDKPLTDYITQVDVTKEQLELVRTKLYTGPNVVEYIHDYGEIYEEGTK